MNVTPVHQWIVESITEMDANSVTFRSDHIDEIFPGLTPTTIDPEFAVSVLEDAVRFLPHRWQGRISLVIPLEETECITTSAPDLVDLPILWNEPPSLYLFGLEYLTSYLHFCEEYRRTYTANPWGVDMAAHVVEFVSSRDRESEEQGWEYSNNIWIHVVRHSGK